MKFSVLDSTLGTVVLFARASHLSRLDLFPSGVESAREWVTLGGFGLGLDMKIKLLTKEGVSVSELRTTMMSS